MPLTLGPMITGCSAQGWVAIDPLSRIVLPFDFMVGCPQVGAGLMLYQPPIAFPAGFAARNWVLRWMLKRLCRPVRTART